MIRPVLAASSVVALWTDRRFRRSSARPGRRPSPALRTGSTQVAQHRPGEHRRPHRRLRRRARARPARRDLRRDRERRRLQEHQPGHVVDADLRSRRRDDVDRRRRRRAVEPEHRLGRHRRSRTTARARRGATASTSRSTAARPGRTWASTTRATSAASSSIPANPDIVYVAARRTPVGTERRARRLQDDRRRRRRGRRCSSSTTTPARPTSSSTRRIRRRCSRRCISASARRGASTAAAPAAASIARDDGGATWTKLAERPAGGDKGRIGLDIFRADPRIVYAVVEARRPRERRLPQRRRRRHVGALVDAQPAADATTARFASIPRTASRVYLLGSNRGFYISDDGGKTFRDVFSTIHSEDHALWIDPDDTEPSDRRRRRRRVDLLGPRPDVAVPRQPAGRPVLRDQRRHAGSVRRSAAACRTTATGACRARRASATASRTATASTSAAATASTRGIDPDRPAHRYRRIAGRARQPRQPGDARAAGDLAAAARAAEAERRARALELEHADRHVALRSQDALHGLAHRVPSRPTAASTWKAISPDLTANVDRESLQMMGAPRPRARAVAARRPDVVLDADDDRRVAARREAALHRAATTARLQVTRDGGQNWTQPQREGLRAAGRHLRQQRAAVAPRRRPRLRDLRRPLQRRLPRVRLRQRRLRPDLAIDRRRACPRRPSTGSASTRGTRGCSSSDTSAACTSRSTAATSWSPLTLNMPTVPVDDILIHPRDHDLVVGRRVGPCRADAGRVRRRSG